MPTASSPTLDSNQRRRDRSRGVRSITSGKSRPTSRSIRGSKRAPGEAGRKARGPATPRRTRSRRLPTRPTRRRSTMACKARARYGLLNIPEPVAAADADFNRGDHAQRVQAGRGGRFQLLDRDRQGRLTLAAAGSALASPCSGRRSRRIASDAVGHALGIPLPPGLRPSAPSSWSRAGGIRTLKLSMSSVSMIWQASRDVRAACAARSSRSSSSSLAGGQLLEILGVDDHVAGRAGHHALARAFERLARGPGDVEQPLARAPPRLPCPAFRPP